MTFSTYNCHYNNRTINATGSSSIMSSVTNSDSVVIKDESSPLAIFLVKSGSKGDRLLFRYPFEYSERSEVSPTPTAKTYPSDTSGTTRNRSFSARTQSSASTRSNLSCSLNTSDPKSEGKRNPYALVLNDEPSHYSLQQHSHHSHLHANVGGHTFHHHYSLTPSVSGPSSFSVGGIGSGSVSSVGGSVVGPGVVSSSGPNSPGLAGGGASGGRAPHVPLCAELQSFYRAQQPLTRANNDCDALIDQSVRDVIDMPDKLLSNLFAVKSDLCGDKFELKINDVRFVGHPLLLSSKSNFEPVSGQPFVGLPAQTSVCKGTEAGPPFQLFPYRSLTLNFSLRRFGLTDREKDLVTFNVVFALRANASPEIVKCYHDCSKRIAIALHFEEQRVGYLTAETKLMTAHEDEMQDEHGPDDAPPYASVMKRSGLARVLRKMYDDLCHLGALYLRINSWIEVSFCLPQKVHKLTLKHHTHIPLLDPSAIQRSLDRLRPYHALLLLVDPRDLFDTLPLDAAPALIRVVQMSSPTKSLLDVSADADVSLTQVFHIAAQLVYWAKATIIYPLCENNVYMVNPYAPLAIESPLFAKYTNEFAGSDLMEFLSEFSFGVSVSQLRNPLHDVDKQNQLIQKIIWLLRHRMLLQVHTYVYFVPNDCSLPYANRRTRTRRSSQTSVDASSSGGLFDSQATSAHTPSDRTGSRPVARSHTTAADGGVDSGSSFASENESLGASPVRFHGKLSSAPQPSLLSSSYPQRHGLANASLFDSNSFENSYSSSYNQNTYGGPIPEGTLNTDDLSHSSNTERIDTTLNDSMAVATAVAAVAAAVVSATDPNADADFDRTTDSQSDRIALSSSLSEVRHEKRTRPVDRRVVSSAQSNDESISKFVSDDDELESNEDLANNWPEEDRLALLLEIGLSKSDCEYVLAISAARNLDDLRLFAQLIGYFDGRNHLEHIMYYANVRRSQLLALIDKFRDVLITAQHEDPAVAELCPFIQTV
jgi:hypothetical protein